MIEKTDLLCGVTAYSNGQLWAGGTSLQEAARIADSPAAAARYLKRKTRLTAGRTVGRVRSCPPSV